MATVYEIITDRVLELLKAGVIPWRKPWRGEGGAPRNLVSQKPYRGINAFLLAVSAYTSPLWVTFKQAKNAGGSVRKGEKATPVIFWRWVEPDDESSDKRRYAEHRVPGRLL